MQIDWKNQQIFATFFSSSVATKEIELWSEIRWILDLGNGSCNFEIWAQEEKEKKMRKKRSGETSCIDLKRKKKSSDQRANQPWT